METLFSKSFSFKTFLKFVAPAIVSMIFISLYTIVDGIFVSQLVGSDALASINITLPIMNIVFGFGIMMSSGGAAITSIKMGQKDKEGANQTFSLVCISAIISGIIVGILGVLNIESISLFLGATPKLLSYCIDYGHIILLFTPFFISKALFEFFIRVDGKFNFSMIITISGGIINIVLDYIFIKYFNMGIGGAALATGLGVLIPSIIGLCYFLSAKSGLKFIMPKFNFKELLGIMANGSSEMVTELSTGITTLIFNLLVLKYAGENGLAALTIILYAHFLLVSTYLGFSMGISPLISYNYGAQNFDKLKETFNYSKRFIIGSAGLIFAISMLFTHQLVGVFVSSNSAVYQIAFSGLRLFSLCFLFVGINVCTSSMFTAFSNGKLSSIIAFSRSFIFVIIGFAILPHILNLNGLWLVVPFAELLTLTLSVFFLNKYKSFYNYG